MKNYSQCIQQKGFWTFPYNSVPSTVIILGLYASKVKPCNFCSPTVTKYKVRKENRKRHIAEKSCHLEWIYAWSGNLPRFSRDSPTLYSCLNLVRNHQLCVFVMPELGRTPKRTFVSHKLVYPPLHTILYKYLWERDCSLLRLNSRQAGKGVAWFSTHFLFQNFMSIFD